MRRLLLVLLIAFCSISNAIAHDFYVSITEIKYNTETKTYQVSMKLFIDNLEDALSDFSKQKINLEQSKNSKSDSLLHAYIQKGFSISDEKQAVDLHYLGYEIENDVAWVYLESKKNRKPSQVEIKNRLLMELFPSQSNLIHLSLDNSTKSLLLNKKESSDILRFP